MSDIRQSAQPLLTKWIRPIPHALTCRPLDVLTSPYPLPSARYTLISADSLRHTSVLPFLFPSYQERTHALDPR